MVYSRGCNIRDIKNIYKKVRYSKNLVKSGTLLLVMAKLDFQALALIGKKMGF